MRAVKISGPTTNRTPSVLPAPFEMNERKNPSTKERRTDKPPWVRIFSETFSSVSTR
jgi:hypothetical protein